MNPNKELSRYGTVSLSIGENEADVDSRIAPLIEELWLNDFRILPLCSAEDGDGDAWIAFLFPEQIPEFLNTIAPDPDEDPDSLCHRIQNEWLYLPRALDVAGRDGGQAASDYKLPIKVFFPPADIPVICHKLREARMLSSNDPVVIA